MISKIRADLYVIRPVFVSCGNDWEQHSDNCFGHKNVVHNHILCFCQPHRKYAKMHDFAFFISKTVPVHYIKLCKVTTIKQQRSACCVQLLQASTRRNKNLSARTITSNKGYGAYVMSSLVRVQDGEGTTRGTQQADLCCFIECDSYTVL